MRTRQALAAAGAALLLLAAAPVNAHHAFAEEFDINGPVKLEGTLTQWEMINPHSWFHLDVKGSDGNVVSWMVEGGSPNQLIKAGVTKYTLKIGTQLIIEGFKAKDGSNKAVGRNLLLSDGRRLVLGGSANTPEETPGAR
jgi:Family of unknown function (DUF6152)